MTHQRWIDVSQPLTNNMPHWPGDTPFSYALTYSLEQTGAANVGEITSSVHIGTHIDAPYHFDEDGKKVLDLDVNLYIGPAKIIDVSHANAITKEMLEAYDLTGVKRLLLHTSLPNNPKRFPETYPYLDPDVGPFLHEQGVQLLGVDMPSVDQVDSQTIDTHHALYQNGVHILENLMLDHVASGNYELIALPLALQEGDGSPVRAVVRPLAQNE